MCLSFFSFLHLSINLEFDIFDLRFPFISLPFATVCIILRFRNSDKNCEKGKKSSATHTSTQLRVQGCKEMCHLLNIWILVLDLGEKDICHYYLHNPLHHVAAVVFLCMQIRGHVKSQQEIYKSWRRVQRAAFCCKTYFDVSIELLPNEPVVCVLVRDPGLRGKKGNVRWGWGPNLKINNKTLRFSSIIVHVRWVNGHYRQSVTGRKAWTLCLFIPLIGWDSRLVSLENK